jgi:hypothetical protein
MSMIIKQEPERGGSEKKRKIFKKSLAAAQLSGSFTVVLGSGSQEKQLLDTGR